MADSTGGHINETSGPEQAGRMSDQMPESRAPASINHPAHAQTSNVVSADRSDRSTPAAQEAILLNTDPARTPRFDEHRTYYEPGELSAASTPTSEQDYFASKAPLRESSSGFLASLSSSNISSPLQSTYASSASLQSTSDPGAERRIALTGMDGSSDALSNDFDTGSADGNVEASSSVAPAPSPRTVSSNAERKRHDGPRYPDQSFAAIHTQTFTPPYSYLKSRSSDYTSNSHSSVSPTRSVGQSSSVASFSRSADHTPLQSPGLFQPPRKPDDAEVAALKTGPYLLHPTHHAQAPKETNKLRKDFDSTTGNKIMNNYEVFQKLGVGSHGAVKRARNLMTAEDVAIKIVRRYGKKGRLGKQETPEDKVKKEVAVLKKARHPHVVSLLEVIDDPEFGKVYLVLEYVELGEIIWRTETNKNLAIFEMQRVRREVAGSANESVENALVFEFNEKVQNKQIMQQNMIQTLQDPSTSGGNSVPASTHAGTVGRDLPLRRHTTSNQPYRGQEHTAAINTPSVWSNEYGGNESDADVVEHSFDSRGRSSKSFEAEAQGGLPTPRPVQQDNNLRINSEGLPKSSSPYDQYSPTLLGSQYGPYVEAISNKGFEAEFRSRLDELVKAEEHWTSEENAYRYVPCLTMTQARDAFRDTVLGLEYLHYQGIIHRDIKPANLLWTSEYRVKISDFGVSYIGRPLREKDDEQEELVPPNLDEAFELAKTVGTPAFYAPELCDPDLFDSSKTSERPQITGQIDVWALGVTLYAMIFGRLPFYDDKDEFAMYEKIARQEVFVSSKRLRGVDENGSLENSNKRDPEIVEYEIIDDELKDLVKRLLHKNPAKRITIKEVKHHPWVLRDIADPSAWIDGTDPSLQSQGKKIEVSTKDVQNAVAPLNLVDRIKHGIKRLGSVVRGRDTRRRAESSSKDATGSGSNSSRASTTGREDRRPSLRGDEQIYSALKASREPFDHPLSQSVAASPAVERGENYFCLPISHLELPSPSVASSVTPTQRPMTGERTESTTESVRTIRPSSDSLAARDSTPSTISEVPHGSTPNESAASSSSALSGILGVASRRLVGTMRSRDRATPSHSTSNISSRASSAENMMVTYEDPHAFPSVALSPAMAAGEVERTFRADDDELHQPQPNSNQPHSPSQSSFERAEEENARKLIRENEEAASMLRARRRSTQTSQCPASPDEAAFAGQHASDQSLSKPASSSEDQVALSESCSNPSIPSSSTSTSHPDTAVSMLATADTITAENFRERQKNHAADTPTPALEDDDAGYHGDGDGNDRYEEGDDYSDDEGIVMGGS